MSSECSRRLYRSDEVLSGLVRKELGERRRQTEIDVTALQGPNFLQAFAQSNQFQKFYEKEINSSLLGSSNSEFRRFFRGELFESIADWYFASLPQESSYTVLSSEKTQQYYWYTTKRDIEEDQIRHRTYLSGIYLPDNIIVSADNRVVGALECKVFPREGELQRQANSFFNQTVRRPSAFDSPEFIIVTPTISKTELPPILRADYIPHLILPFNLEDFAAFSTMISYLYRPDRDGATLHEMQQWARNPWW